MEMNLKTDKGVKKIQIEGKKHVVLSADADIEKLIKRGLSIKGRMEVLKAGLETIQDRLIELAKQRREKTTTVTLGGVTTDAVVTFRESFVVSDDIEDIKVPLGPLFDRFFNKKTEYKTTADFKKFIESENSLGVKDPDVLKKKIFKYVSTKETKPNVKMERKAG
jgi:hypothetical protein